MENFTWQILITTGGAATFVALVTQFTKGLGFLDKINTKIQVYVLSLIITALATFFVGIRDVPTYALLPVNAFIVSLTAMGEYHEIFYKIDINSKNKNKNKENYL